jgi:uncharacterized DUF497 family protein
MRFEWDQAKAASNLVKHDISFELATRVWEDPLHELRFDRVENGEERWHAIGFVGAELLVVAIHTYPDPVDKDLVRIISARQATRQERRFYEQEDF